MGGNVRDAFKGEDRRPTNDAMSEREQAGTETVGDTPESDGRYGQREHELFCPYCGERGCAEGDNYCLNCGAKLEGTFE